MGAWNKITQQRPSHSTLNLSMCLHSQNDIIRSPGKDHQVLLESLWADGKPCSRKWSLWWVFAKFSSDKKEGRCDLIEQKNRNPEVIAGSLCEDCCVQDAVLCPSSILFWGSTLRIFTPNGWSWPSISKEHLILKKLSTWLNLLISMTKWFKHLSFAQLS